MKRLKKIGLLLGIMVLTLALLAACGGANNTAPTPAPAPTEPAPTEPAPAPQEGTAGEDAANADLVATGEEVAKKSCIGCHGGNLEGQGSYPSLHNLTLSKEEIIEVLEKGQGSMPPGLAKGNEEAVAEYLLTLK